MIGIIVIAGIVVAISCCCICCYKICCNRKRRGQVLGSGLNGFANTQRASIPTLVYSPGATQPYRYPHQAPTLYQQGPTTSVVVLTTTTSSSVDQGNSGPSAYPVQYDGVATTANLNSTFPSAPEGSPDGGLQNNTGMLEEQPPPYSSLAQK